MRTAASISYLDGKRLALAMQAGVARLNTRQSHLNRINVFPVADGDTGTNLGFTLESMVAGLRSRPERHAGRALSILADAGLDGARGNSGAIMAQFFQGLAEAGGRRERLGVRTFAEIVDQGARHARAALSEPREGTLVTVLTVFATSVREQAGRIGDDFAGLLAAALAHCEAALARTPEQLSVLRRAGVVDAGAEGFVELLRGMGEALESGRELVRVEHRPEETAAAVAPAGTGEAARYRYCTECVIEGEALDAEWLRAELAGLGDSQVVAGARHKLKLHIHTNTPGAVFRLASRLGQVGGEKADDMWRQQQDVRQEGGRVAIVTDSSADIPESVIEASGIHVVPVHVHFGDRQYLDRIGLGPEQFYRELARNPNHPVTSQPSPGEFRRIFRMLASHFETVIAIHVTAQGSGTWQAARSAAGRVPDADIRVVDSRTVSAGLGLMVMEAAERAREGQGADEIMARLDAIRARTRVWGAVADLAFAVRGGRVAPWKKRVADALRIMPVLTARAGGRVDAGGLLWGRGNREAAFVRFVRRRMGNGRRYRLLLGHCNAPEAGERLLAALEDMPALVEPPRLVAVGPALGAHAGPGTLVAALQEREVT